MFFFFVRFSNVCLAASLIFLHFFIPVLLYVPHFRWLTTVLAVKMGVEVLGLVKVGDDGLPQSQEED